MFSNWAKKRQEKKKKREKKREKIKRKQIAQAKAIAKRAIKTSTQLRIPEHTHIDQFFERSLYKVPSILWWCENCNRTGKRVKDYEIGHKYRIQCPSCEESTWIRIFYSPCCFSART